jgi:hypothetical protein
MYSPEHQSLFDKAISESTRGYQNYSKLLKESGLNRPEIKGAELFESIVQLLFYSADPLSDNEQAQAMSWAKVAAAYHRKNIGNKENKGDYIPLSNIL